MPVLLCSILENCYNGSCLKGVFPMYKKFWLSMTALLTVLACLLPMEVLAPTAEARWYQRVVILSDIHYGSKSQKPDVRTRKIHNKEQAVRDINRWQDVDLCVFTGDMVQKTGSPADYKLARKLTDHLKKPKEFLAGNHEIIYHRDLSSTGKLVPADSYERSLHMQQYEKNFGPLYHSRKLGPYFLLFLSPDTLESKYAVELSKEQLDWLKKELKDHRQEPTLIFCHAPVTGTMVPGSKLDKPRNYVQPAKAIGKLLQANPQILLWVSGHTHTSPKNPSFSNPVNQIAGTAILDVYNPTWDGKQVWTNSLYLYPEKIQIRTYSHKTHQWLPQFDRTVWVPRELRKGVM